MLRPVRQAPSCLGNANATLFNYIQTHSQRSHISMRSVARGHMGFSRLAKYVRVAVHRHRLPLSPCAAVVCKRAIDLASRSTPRWARPVACRGLRSCGQLAVCVCRLSSDSQPCEPCTARHVSTVLAKRAASLPVRYTAFAPAQTSTLASSAVRAVVAVSLATDVPCA